ncbi:MAG TPA: hypothetical protein VJ810_16200 [Blastocatellia bacterium]|nr:hypothetical protein [Blastocatellia bacterium]
MRKTLIATLALACVLTLLLSASAKIDSTKSGDSTGDSAQKAGPQLPPDEVIRRFTKKESELREIWKEYAYDQESRIQTIGQGDTITGEFYQVSEFVFNDAGQRIERITKAPPSTLYEVSLTPEDRNAFINLQPFALTAEELPNYNVNYVGKEKVDELNTYVFDVVPKVLSNQRDLERLRKQKIEGKFFHGKIWVDDQDLQIVKSAGKIAPEFDQRFVKFETYRENVDERFWLPTYTYGDERLFFAKGGSPRIRMTIKYKNYRRFTSDVKLLDATEEVKEGQPAAGAKSATGAKPGASTPGETKKEETKKEEANKPKQRPRP